MSMLLPPSALPAAPAADEVLARAKARANSESKTIFLVFDSPG